MQLGPWAGATIAFAIDFYGHPHGLHPSGLLSHPEVLGALGGVWFGLAGALALVPIADSGTRFIALTCTSLKFLAVFLLFGSGLACFDGLGMTPTELRRSSDGVLFSAPLWLFIGLAVGLGISDLAKAHKRPWRTRAWSRP